MVLDFKDKCPFIVRSKGFRRSRKDSIQYFLESFFGQFTLGQQLHFISGQRRSTGDSHIRLNEINSVTLIKCSKIEGLFTWLRGDHGIVYSFLTACSIQTNLVHLIHQGIHLRKLIIFYIKDMKFFQLTL